MRAGLGDGTRFEELSMKHREDHWLYAESVGWRYWFMPSVYILEGPGSWGLSSEGGEGTGEPGRCRASTQGKSLAEGQDT